MGKKAPETPDYRSLALEQGQMNEAAARTANLMNNPNQVTPTGSTSYSAPDASGRATRTETLSPDELNKLNLGNAAQIAALGKLNESIPTLLKGVGGFDISGTPQGDFDPRLNPAQGYQLDSGIEQAPDLQSQLDYSGAPKMPGTGKGARDEATDAVYREQTRQLDPQFEQAEGKMKADLANQGIQPGSKAYKDATENFSRTKQQAYSSARDQAITGGRSEYESQFGTGLQARQQGVTETTTQGQFGNQARQSAIDQLLASMGASNNALAQQYSTAAQGTNLSNAARAQQLTEQAQQMQIPVNIFSALMNGSQVNSPNFQPFSQNTNIEAAPIYQSGKDTYSAANDAANRQSALTGQIIGAVGSVAGGFA
jgi:hypothetical protein